MSTPTITLTYSQRDVADILSQLYAQVSTFTDNEWNSFLNSDVGTALLQIFSQLGDWNAFFTDANTNECFLLSCLLRESGVRKAKELNYIPSLAVPATCTARITFPVQGSNVDIAAGSTWTINGIPFVCQDALVLTAGQTQLTISLIQGTPYSLSLTPPGTPWYPVVLPTNACNIAVKVNDTLWTATDSWTLVTTPTTYKLYENTTGQTIMFGNNQNPSYLIMPLNTDSVAITALLTLGIAGNIETPGGNVIPTTAIYNAGDTLLNGSINGVALTAALGGLNVESLLSIQQNAPAWYGTQGRAVIDTDYQVIVNRLSGITDAVVIGGEDPRINDYGFVHCLIYGDSPYSVSTDLCNEVVDALTALNVVTVTPKAYGPNVIELAMTLGVGITQEQFLDAALANTAVTNAIDNYFNPIKLGGQLSIGSPLYHSALDAVLQGLGIVYADASWVLDSFAISSAGVVKVPVPSNVVLTSCTLTGADAGLLFSGNGTSMASGNVFQFSQAGLADQLCTLTYTTSNGDVLVAYNQKIVLTGLSLNVTYVG